MSASSSSLLYVAGEAQQTLMMSDRTLTLDSLPGGVLKWSLTHFAVSLISALFMLLSQQFISHFIPRSFILQSISCDGIGCSDDSL